MLSHTTGLPQGALTSGRQLCPPLPLSGSQRTQPCARALPTSSVVAAGPGSPLPGERPQQGLQREVSVNPDPPLLDWTGSPVAHGVWPWPRGPVACVSHTCRARPCPQAVLVAEQMPSSGGDAAVPPGGADALWSPFLCPLPAHSDGGRTPGVTDAHRLPYS